MVRLLLNSRKKNGFKEDNIVSDGIDVLWNGFVLIVMLVLHRKKNVEGEKELMVVSNNMLMLMVGYWLVNVLWGKDEFARLS